MSGLLSERVGALQAYQPGEQPRDGALVKLNTNENPYPPSPQVAEAVARAAGDSLNLYPSPMADELREKAAERYGVAPDQVLVGNGSDELLALCLRACVVDGERVAYQVPSYSLYRTLAELAGAEVVEVARPAHKAREDGSQFTSMAALGARVIFVCTPNSPFGDSTPTEQLDELARRSEALVVADEAYVDFGGASALTLLEHRPNLIVLRSFSKSFSLAGVRLGLAFGEGRLMAGLAKAKDSYNVSRLAIAAGVAALDDYPWMEANVARVRATRERVSRALLDAGYAVRPSDANFLWVDCGRAVGETGGKAVYERLRARGILVRYFDTAGLQAGIRVTIGTDEQMDRFLAALAE